MSGLTIPDRDRRGLAVLRDMSDESLAQFLSGINQSPDSAPTVTGISVEDANLARSALTVMYEVRALTEVPLPEFIADVCEALRKENELQPDAEAQFRRRLEDALTVDALSIKSKASILHNEHANLFCSARIVTDARPVYGEKVIEPPVAIVVTHTLKIDYHGVSGRLNEIYLGLGSSDLRELRSVLNRAEEKAESLKALFKAPLRVIDPQQP